VRCQYWRQPNDSWRTPGCSGAYARLEGILVASLHEAGILHRTFAAMSVLPYRLRRFVVLESTTSVGEDVASDE
jgi:hypothetical protein